MSDDSHLIDSWKQQYVSKKSEINEIDEQIHALRQLRCRLQEELDHLGKRIQSAESQAQDQDGSIDWSSDDGFPWSAKIKTTLRKCFTHKELRLQQLQVINATLSNRNVFVLMKTGGGKSLCYQLPAMMDEGGITLVIAPLISLIRDQVRYMNQIAPASAAFLSGKVEKSEQRDIFADISSPTKSSLRLLFTTPEKVHKSKLFMTNLQKAYNHNKLRRIVIDEAHCVSQWGHDFRPDYASLGLLKKLFLDVPILALTATASQMVRDDVLRILCIDGSYSSTPFSIDCSSASSSARPSTMLPPIVLASDFDRPNLNFSVWMKPEDFDESIALVVQALSRPLTTNHSAIIYCFTQSKSLFWS
jgi:ATP-dependent DNA helicase Q1